MNADILDERALIRKRLRAGGHAIDAVFVWHGEDFFRGQVRNTADTIFRRGCAAKPRVIIGKSDAKIGARPTKMKRRKPSSVQQLDTPLEFRRMCLPNRNGIAMSTRVAQKMASIDGQTPFLPDRQEIPGAPKAGVADRNNSPVDLVTGDQLERRAACLAEAATLARDTFAGFWPARRTSGSAPAIANLAAPLRKPAANPSWSQRAAVSKLSSAAY